MTDQDATEKMRELMSTIDAMTRYRNIWFKMPAVILIALISILISTIIYAVVDVIGYFAVTWVGNIMVGNGSYIGAGIFAAFAWAGGE